MNLMEKFSDPGLIHELSMGEKLIGSGVTALMGIGITFMVLIFLWACIAAMSRIMVRNKKKSDRASAGTAEAASSAPCILDAGPAATGDQGLQVSHIPIAVIAAAVYAYEGSSTLRIRKISRQPGRHFWSQPINERKVIK